MGKSLHYMEREGMWWGGKKWHPDTKEYKGGLSNVRRFRTVRKMEAVFESTPVPCAISAHYYYRGRRGTGWVLKWRKEK